MWWFITDAFYRRKFYPTIFGDTKSIQPWIFRASRQLHNKALFAMVRSPMRYFDTHPIGLFSIFLWSFGTIASRKHTFQKFYYNMIMCSFGMSTFNLLLFLVHIFRINNQPIFKRHLLYGWAVPRSFIRLCTVFRPLLG